MQELTEFNIEKTTAEILMLKEQTAQNIIEIGKRLIEVKEKLPHGEYLNWLENSVDFTERTAQRFVKVATAFSNATPVSHLGTRKLFALAGLDEEDREELMQKNNVEDMTTRELEQVVKEKKEIKKQLEEEQAYSDELQTAIREKEEEIRELKQKIEEVQEPEIQVVEKEVVKEVIPEDFLNRKKELEQEVEQLKKRAEKAEDTIKSIKLESKLEEDKVFNTARLDELIVNTQDFLRKNSKFTYLKDEFKNISAKNRKFVQQNVNSIKDWVMLMEQALENKDNIVGNIIIGEGEIVDE